MKENITFFTKHYTDVYTRKRYRRVYIFYILILIFLSIVIFIARNYKQKTLLFKEKIAILNEQLDSTKDLLTELEYRFLQKDSINFFKDLGLRDASIPKSDVAAILRLFDIAKYAIQKNDFAYAELKYNEVNKIRSLPLTSYYLGRLSYSRNDKDKAEREWKQAIETDSINMYPEFKLYLGILLFEKNKIAESNHYLKLYLQRVE